MITWGIISAAMAFIGPMANAVGISVESMFYVMRFLLGAAEAGFFPGIILYFNYWYPSHRQSNALSLLLAAQPIAFILGAPLSGAIMDGFADVGGMHGWQWMYILEAAPSVVLGLAVFFHLTNGVDYASRINSPWRDPAYSSAFACRWVKGGWHALADAGSGPAV